MLESMRAPATPRLDSTFPTASPEALDLLERLLHFNPDRRISPEEALRHPYCAQFHNPHDEPTAPATITIPIDDNTKVGAWWRWRWRWWLHVLCVCWVAPHAWHHPHNACLPPCLPPSPPPLPAPICPSACLPACLQYSISEYRDRLYLEIVKRKKELRRAAKDREAAKAAASRSKSRSSGYHGSSAAPAAGAYGSSAAYGHAAVRH